MIGPGKYDKILTEARQTAKAEGAILIVFNGEHGPGFSCQLPAHLYSVAASVLRQVADNMDANSPMKQIAEGN